VATSNVRSRIWLEDLMNSTCRRRWSAVSSPASIPRRSLLLTSATTMLGVAGPSPSMYFLARSPSGEALKYSIQA
jgi:hypothetical protein